MRALKPNLNDVIYEMYGVSVNTESDVLNDSRNFTTTNTDTNTDQSVKTNTNTKTVNTERSSSSTSNLDEDLTNTSQTIYQTIMNDSKKYNDVSKAIENALGVSKKIASAFKTEQEIIAENRTVQTNRISGKVLNVEAGGIFDLSQLNESQGEIGITMAVTEICNMDVNDETKAMVADMLDLTNENSSEADFVKLVEDMANTSNKNKSSQSASTDQSLASTTKSDVDLTTKQTSSNASSSSADLTSEVETKKSAFKERLVDVDVKNTEKTLSGTTINTNVNTNTDMSNTTNTNTSTLNSNNSDTSTYGRTTNLTNTDVNDTTISSDKTLDENIQAYANKIAQNIDNVQENSKTLSDIMNNSNIAIQTNIFDYEVVNIKGTLKDIQSNRTINKITSAYSQFMKDFITAVNSTRNEATNSAKADNNMSSSGKAKTESKRSNSVSNTSDNTQETETKQGAKSGQSTELSSKTDQSAESRNSNDVSSKSSTKTTKEGIFSTIGNSLSNIIDTIGETVSDAMNSGTIIIIVIAICAVIAIAVFFYFGGATLIESMFGGRINDEEAIGYY